MFVDFLVMVPFDLIYYLNFTSQPWKQMLSDLLGKDLFGSASIVHILVPAESII